MYNNLKSIPVENSSMKKVILDNSSFQFYLHLCFHFQPDSPNCKTQNLAIFMKEIFDNIITLGNEDMVSNNSCIKRR